MRGQFVCCLQPTRSFRPAPVRRHSMVRVASAITERKNKNKVNNKGNCKNRAETRINDSLKQTGKERPMELPTECCGSLCKMFCGIVQYGPQVWTNPIQ